MKLAAMNSTIGPGAAAFERARKLGIDGVEVDLSIKPLLAGDRAQLDAALAASHQHGVAIASAVLGEHNGGGLATWWRKPEDVAAEVRCAIDAAKTLGCDALLVPFFFFNEPKGKPHRDEVARRIKPLARYAQDAGVRFCYEGVTTAAHFLDMAAIVDSNFFGTYYDPANHTWCDHDIVAEAKLLGRKLFRTHVKEAKTFTADARPGQGRVDHAAYAAALKSIGYDDWYTLETPNGPDADVAADAAFARKVYGA